MDEGGSCHSYKKVVVVSKGDSWKLDTVPNSLNKM